MPYGSRGLSAGNIAAQIGMAPSTLSFHLRQMTQAGVLTQHRSSRQIIYAVNTAVVNGVCLFHREALDRASHSNAHAVIRTIRQSRPLRQGQVQ